MPIAANLRIGGSIGEAAPATPDPAAGDIFNLALASFTLAASSGEGPPAGDAAQAPAAAAEEPTPDEPREESDPLLAMGELLRLSPVELAVTPRAVASDKAAAAGVLTEQPLVDWPALGPAPTPTPALGPAPTPAPAPGPGTATAAPPAASAPAGKLATLAADVAAAIAPQPEARQQSTAGEGAKAHPLAAPAQQASAQPAIQADGKAPVPAKAGSPPAGGSAIPVAASTAASANAAGVAATAANAGPPGQLPHPESRVEPAAAGDERKFADRGGSAPGRGAAPPPQAAAEKAVADPLAPRLVSGADPAPAPRQAPLDRAAQPMEKPAPVHGVQLLQPELAQARKSAPHPRAAPAMTVPEASATALPEASATGPTAPLLSRQDPALAPGPAAVPTEAAAEASAPAAQAQPAEAVVEAALDLAVETEWLDHLVRDIASASSEDGSPLRFRLNPEHLGTLRVEISTDRSGSAVRITADTEAARSIIADAQPRLVAEARAQGVRISETHVELGSQQGSGDPRRQAEAFREAPLRTARLLHEADPSDGNPTRTKTDRYA